jgi:hypothetical protein
LTLFAVTRERGRELFGAGDHALDGCHGGDFADLLAEACEDVGVYAARPQGNVRAANDKKQEKS